MASGKLLAARVAVVDDEQKAALDGVCGLRDPVLRGQRNFDALVCLGKDAMAIEEFELFGCGRQPDFGETAVLESDVKVALRAQNLYGKGVEEFVGEDDEWSS